MALTKCKECGKEISKKAKVCPGCGHPVKKKSGCAPVMLIAILLILLLSLYSPPEPPKTSVPPSVALKKSPTDGNGESLDGEGVLIPRSMSGDKGRYLLLKRFVSKTCG